MRPESRDIRGAEEEEPDTQGQLGIELARLVKDELAGNSAQQGQQCG